MGYLNWPSCRVIRTRNSSYRGKLWSGGFRVIGVRVIRVKMTEKLLQIQGNEVGSINYFCNCIGLDWGVLQMCDAARCATVRGMRAMRGMRGVRGMRGIKVMIQKKNRNKRDSMGVP